jgi:hypothetical protein
MATLKYETSLSSVIGEIEVMLKAKFGANGRNLAAKVDNVGRQLPRDVRKHLQLLIDAEARTENPKFANQYDPKAILKSFEVCKRYLEGVDLGAKRSYRRTAWLAGAVFNLFIVIGLFALGLSLLR